MALNDAAKVTTKTTAILPLLADLSSETPLFAPVGSLDHSQIQSYLGYLSTEVCMRLFPRYQSPAALLPAARGDYEPANSRPPLESDHHIANLSTPLHRFVRGGDLV